MKTWIVTAVSHDYYYYEVDAETKKQALIEAKEQLHNESPQDWDVNFDIDEESENEAKNT